MESGGSADMSVVTRKRMVDVIGKTEVPLRRKLEGGALWVGAGAEGLEIEERVSLRPKQVLDDLFMMKDVRVVGEGAH